MARIATHPDTNLAFKVQVCGFYVSLFADGGKATSFVDIAWEQAQRYIKTEGWQAVSIHAFDGDDNFSHVVN